ncbi:hypothetical protein ABE424_18290 [Stenotrophomonas sp. TWI1149]|uniref:hypothetical protein n=1 Tax=unclassified Stenotrophomonas TaxID=196198 RepID=UPI00320AC5F1
MSILDGVSQCWWLSETCQLDWEATSAVATAAGVIVALAAPAISRYRTRRRANALFALAFYDLIARAKARLEVIEVHYPLGAGTAVSWAAEGLLMTNAVERATFAAMPGALADLARVEIDLSRWPVATDLELAESVALAVHAASRVCDAIDAGGNGTNGSKHWGTYWISYRADMDFAHKQVERALRACGRATEGARQ